MPSAAKAAFKIARLIAAVNRCATQNQVQHRSDFSRDLPDPRQKKGRAEARPRLKEETT
jgi:hypothetical protein